MALPSKYNNPMAMIQSDPDSWKGLIGSSPNGFLQFDRPASGIRAGVINLYNAYLKRGHDTIAKIFPIYAPAGHGANEPAKYAASVSKLTGIGKDTKITTPQQVEKIARAIIQVEEGSFWVTEKEFKEGFENAMSSMKIKYAVGIGSGVLILLGITAFLLFKK